MAAIVHTLLLVVMLTLGAGGAAAQEWPAKAIRLNVPFPPGGGTDILARVIANKLSESLRQPVVIENKPGAGGNIGVDLTAKAAADGYTLVIGQTANLAINPTLYANIPYDPFVDLVPVALIADAPIVIVVEAGSPLRTLADVVAAAKAKPDTLTVASPGNGTVAHLTAEVLQGAAGIKLAHIPYKGSGQAITDLLGGRIDMFMASVPTALAQIKAGRLRALAVTSAARSPSLPDVATVGEVGYAGFDANSWYGILAPAKTPPAIVDRLNAEINAVLKSPEVRDKIASEGGTALGGTAERFGALLRSDAAKWAAIVKASGAKLD